MRSWQLWAGKKFTRSEIVKPPLAWFETRDDRVPGSCMVLRRMLTGRAITTTYMATLGASTKMKPPAVGCQAFDTTRATRLDQGVDAVSFSFHGASNTLAPHYQDPHTGG
jgi:hypothetical protein